MNRLTRAIIALVGAATLAGCATGRTLSVREAGNPPLFSGLDRPQLYSGHQLNMAAIRHDTQTLGWFYSRGIEPPSHPRLDLAPSLAADTLIAPLILLGRADNSVSHFIGAGFERYPLLQLGYKIPYYVMTAPFELAIRADEYVGAQIDERRAAQSQPRNQSSP